MQKLASILYSITLLLGVRVSVKVGKSHRQVNFYGAPYRSRPYDPVKIRVLLNLDLSTQRRLNQSQKIVQGRFERFSLYTGLRDAECC